MRSALAQADVPLAPGDALRLWSDVSRWPSFIEGFARVVDNDPRWPAADSRLIWESVPAGRGRVTEKVVQFEPDLLATMVFEDRLAGRQTFRAAPAEPGSLVQLELDYTLTKYGPFGAVADVLFIRRALRDSLRRTLFRFAIEAEEEAGLR